MNKTEYIIEPRKYDLTIVRWFDAPIALVFKAHTDPQAIPQWWGPAYLSTTVEYLEAHVGGRWRFVQTDPDGNQHIFHGVFHHVSEDCMVQTFEYAGAPGHVQLNRMTLEEVGGRTRMTAHSVFQSVEARDGMVEAGMQKGHDEGMGRLDRWLEGMEQKV